MVWFIPAVRNKALPFPLLWRQTGILLTSQCLNNTEFPFRNTTLSPIFRRDLHYNLSDIELLKSLVLCHNMWLYFYLHTSELKSCLFSWIGPFVADTSSLFVQIFGLLARGSKTWILLMLTRVRDDIQVSPGWERHWRTLLHGLLLNLNGLVFACKADEGVAPYRNWDGLPTDRRGLEKTHVTGWTDTFCGTVLAMWAVKFLYVRDEGILGMVDCRLGSRLRGYHPVAPRPLTLSLPNLFLNFSTRCM
jgi:hypothetical protein